VLRSELGVEIKAALRERSGVGLVGPVASEEPTGTSTRAARDLGARLDDRHINISVQLEQVVRRHDADNTAADNTHATTARHVLDFFLNF
jgi:hypothetical protein